MSNSNLHEALTTLVKALEENMWEPHNRKHSVMRLMCLLRKLEIKGVHVDHIGFNGLIATINPIK